MTVDNHGIAEKCYFIFVISRKDYRESLNSMYMYVLMISGKDYCMGLSYLNIDLLYFSITCKKGNGVL